MIVRLRSGQSVGYVQILSVVAIAFLSFSQMYVSINDAAYFPKTFFGRESTLLKTPIGIDDTKRATRRYFENSTERTSLEPVPRPLIEDLVVGPKVTGDVAWLLQFAVLGFPKCGTSFMMRYLGQHDEIAMLTDKEHCELTTGTKDSFLVKTLLDKLPSGNYARGLKCPKQLEDPLAMDRLFRYFPNVRVIVGVRHPVLWYVPLIAHDGIFTRNESILTSLFEKYEKGLNLFTTVSLHALHSSFGTVFCRCFLTQDICF
jgi:hypothetical protein